MIILADGNEPPFFLLSIFSQFIPLSPAILTLLSIDAFKPVIVLSPTRSSNFAVAPVTSNGSTSQYSVRLISLNGQTTPKSYVPEWKVTLYVPVFDTGLTCTGAYTLSPVSSSMVPMGNVYPLFPEITFANGPTTYFEALAEEISAAFAIVIRLLFISIMQPLVSFKSLLIVTLAVSIVTPSSFDLTISTSSGLLICSL